MSGQNVLALEKNFTSDKFPSSVWLQTAFRGEIVSAKTPGDDGGFRSENDAPSVSTYAGAGLQFAVALVLFALGGNWLDGKAGTAPLFLMLGVFGGGAAAFYSMYRKLMASHENKPEKQ